MWCASYLHYNIKYISHLAKSLCICLLFMIEIIPFQLMGDEKFCNHFVPDPNVCL